MPTPPPDNPAMQDIGWPETPLRVVVALGESSTQGKRASREKLRWTSQLENLINEFQLEPVRMINAGVHYNAMSPESKTQHSRGFNGRSGLERIDDDVLRHRPNLIIVQYGLNDMGGLNPVEWFVSEYQKLIDHMRAHGDSLIILVDVAHLTAYGDECNAGDDDFTHAYNEAIARLAQRNGLPCVSMHRAFNHQDKWINDDRIHPNDLGHRVMAHEIFKVIAGGG